MYAVYDITAYALCILQVVIFITNKNIASMIESKIMNRTFASQFHSPALNNSQASDPFHRCILAIKNGIPIVNNIGKCSLLASVVGSK